MTEKELQQFVATAKLGRIRRYRRFRVGQANKTYLVTTSSGRYCVRVYQHKAPDEIAFELALLNHLSNLPAPRLQPIGKRYYGTIDGRPATVYDYIEGAQLRVFSERQLFEVGRWLARFHVRGLTFKWPGRRFRFYDLPPRRIKRVVRLAKQRRLPHRRLLPRLVYDLRRYAPPPSLPQGPIHVDVKPENVLFNHGHLSGVLDFDNSYIGPYLLDVATSMVWFGVRRARFDLRPATALYRGYTSVRRLTKPEYRHLYRLLRYKFVSHVFVDYYMRAAKVTTASYFLWVVRNIYSAYKHFDISSEQFYSFLKEY